VFDCFVFDMLESTEFYQAFNSSQSSNSLLMNQDTVPKLGISMCLHVNFPLLINLVGGNCHRMEVFYGTL